MEGIRGPYRSVQLLFGIVVEDSNVDPCRARVGSTAQSVKKLFLANASQNIYPQKTIKAHSHFINFFVFLSAVQIRMNIM